MNIYLDLTRAFNQGSTRAMLSGGQAVVLHRLAIMSKDGDWILREDQEALDHVLNELALRGARYRFGAPLDLRWLTGGWSAHLEFEQDGLRIRTDFVTRPPRLSGPALDRLWKSQEGQPIPKAPPAELAEMKKTNRDKDYAVIGELARIMDDPDEQILYSRSARDLLAMAETYPDRVDVLSAQRPVLSAIRRGSDALEAALDAERRQLMHANERRLAAYLTAAEPWAADWPKLSDDLRSMPLREAHRILCGRAESRLPFTVPEAGV